MAYPWRVQEPRLGEAVVAGATPLASDVRAATVTLGRTVTACGARHPRFTMSLSTGIRSGVMASGRSPSITTSTTLRKRPVTRAP